MPFTLSRGGNNVIAEVQRWQYFLRRQNFPQVGNIDGDFGLNTEAATKYFQTKFSITTNGKLDARTLSAAEALGYTVLPNDYYSQRSEKSYPPQPGYLQSPSNTSRNRAFDCFQFLQRPLSQRPDEEAIVIKGNCDGEVADWTAMNITTVDISQLRFAKGYSGSFRCHRKTANQFQLLFQKWENDDLLHLIMSYEGCFVSRYKRDQAPAGSGGHSLKKSCDVSELSNHSFGSAFDMNCSDNQLGKVPARCGKRGSVRELVASANEIGVYWGGHFSNQDGMHFEVSTLTDQ
ncbi:M15 family metallopeptidase [Agrobacterium vitis]